MMCFIGVDLAAESSRKRESARLDAWTLTPSTRPRRRNDSVMGARTKVQKLVSCLNTCIFPDKTTYPIDQRP